VRISIWQQFSSNHSGGFDLVAQFKTPEEAQKAFATVKGFIQKIADYYAAHEDELEKQRPKHGLLYITPVEEELARQYNLTDWELSVDWAPFEADPDPEMAKGLKVFQNLVFLYPVIETWLNAKPFDELFEQLGGKVALGSGVEGDEEFKFRPVVNMTCIALDEQTAAEIVQKLNYLNRYEDWIWPQIRVPDYYEPIDGLITYSGSTIACQDMQTDALFMEYLKAYLEGHGCTAFEFSISNKSLD
jgi:hypothetical protein